MTCSEEFEDGDLEKKEEENRKGLTGISTKLFIDFMFPMFYPNSLGY